MEIHIHIVHILMEIMFIYLAVGFFKDAYKIYKLL